MIQTLQTYWKTFPPLLQYLIIFVIIAGVAGGIAAYLTYFERKVLAAIQSRIGPNRVGRYGLLQPIADLMKLLQKEDIVPLRADAVLFRAAPYVVFTSGILSLVIVPFGKGLIAGDLHIGLVYLIAVSSLTVIGIFMAGWASNNKYSLYGAMRSIAQLVSYELPMGFALLGVAALAGSLRVSEIIEKQQVIWFIVPQFLGFLIFLITGIAETNRTPFDLPEAESELVAGFTTEYSGIRFGLFFAAEYLSVFIVSAFVTAFYLGGWLSPLPLPLSQSLLNLTTQTLTHMGLEKSLLPLLLLFNSMFWFFLKVSACIFLLFWVRATLPRFRVDQLMGFAWKILLPLSMVNLVIAGLEGIVWNLFYPT